jgi:hypothetical protein
MVVDNSRIRRNLEIIRCGLVDSLAQNSDSGTEENHEKPQPG